MSLRFRQIHLDFHTSEHVPGIGSEFVAGEFVDTLKRAHVNSVTLFSRCHHGMIYHDTRFPARHPHLTCNLLAEQITACHAEGIRCPIYITVGLDEYTAQRHPEWLEVDENGRRSGAAPLQAGWHKFCFASPYMDYVIEQTEEVCDLFGDEVDGFFFDIIGQGGVFSRWCLAEFDRQGWDPADAGAQQAMRQLLVDRYRERITNAVRAKLKRPDLTIFHNSGHIYPNWRPTLWTYSHLELESLPSGGWGYAHYPVTVRYARTLGLDYLGMTGKFAKTWGHFNSFKPQAALEYECFNMLATGAKCSIGDQLHPGGRLDPATYQLIGAVYEQVEAREPWCDNVEGLADIGVFNIEATGREDGRVDSAALGAYRMLLERQHQYESIDGKTDWSRYRVVILPDKVLLDDALAAKVEAYVSAGGSLLLSHESGMDPGRTRFVLDCMPAEYAGALPFHPDFLLPLADQAAGTLPTPYVMYEPGLKVASKPGAEVLGEIWEPYFNRTWRHFVSHNHTPVRGRGEDPGIVQSGRVVYFSHPVFACYGKHGMMFYRDVALNALRRLLPDPLVLSDAPTTLQVTWNRQPAEGRSVVHLLHYIPEKRTLGPEYVEDVIPLYNVGLKLRASAPRRVYLAPGDGELPFVVEGGYVRLTVPEVRGHTMVVMDE
ncbi:MAG: beta-galactosidase trimerization domain-containing protein [Armatimonadetes bacterium]|nr:beta-galactosidase trimerization domain-containing protein [Armatimonadota bacterium]